MNICIPIEFKAQGGGFYFLQSFAAYLKGRGHTVTGNLDAGYDVLFTNHWMVHRGKILRAIRRNPRVRIVQRVDGAAQDYGRLDGSDEKQRRVNELADATIFQSRYCRYSTREKFSAIVRDGPVIYNPVDVNLFTPHGPRRTFDRRVLAACVSWSTNPLKGAAAIYETARRNPEVGFVLCGRFPDAPRLPNLLEQGVLDREGLAAVLRSCQVMLTLSKNEACPNHVLEALSSGLPVLYDDSGAMSEVTGDCGLSVTPGTFASRLSEIMLKREALSKKARERAVRQFHPERIFPQYLQMLTQALQKPTAVPCLYRLVLAVIEPTARRGRQALQRKGV